MAIASAPMPYNTLIGPDYREENVYPEEHPGLVIIHDSPDEKAKAHWHPGLEFVYSSHGSCPFIVDGQEMPLNTGDLLLLFLLFFLFKQKADEELLIAIGLLLIL